MAARRRLEETGNIAGSLRYARYLWDFRSGLTVACDQQANRLFYIPSPFGPSPQGLFLHRLTHGWLVVFNPPDREAINPEECIVAWVDEADSHVRVALPSKPKRL